MSIEHIVPESERGRTDYFYLRNIVQGALASEWIRVHPDKTELDWFIAYNSAFKKVFPSPSEDPTVCAEIARLSAFFMQAPPEQVSSEVKVLQARLDQSLPSIS